MTIQPRDMTEFLDALGERYIRRALVNGEFGGKAKTAAEQWLAQRGVNWTRLLAITGVTLTMIGILVTISLKFFGHAQ